MQTLIMIGQLLLSLSILITLHEFGHFFFARLFKTRVNKFYLFFDFLFPMPNLLNFSLFKKKIGDTEWGLGWFPFGGYVQIDGMVDETQTAEELAAKPPQPWEFRSKKPWQRLLIMLGGIIVNVILGILIYWFVLGIWGTTTIDNSSIKNGLVFNDSIMTNMGFKNGDKLVSINGKEIKNFDNNALVNILVERGTTQVNRNGENININIPNDILGTLAYKKLDKRGLIGLRYPNIIGHVGEKDKMYKEGFRTNDIIKSLDGQVVNFYDEMRPMINKKNVGDSVLIEIQRGVETQKLYAKILEDKIIAVPPMNDFDKLDSQGLLKHKKINYSFGEALPAALSLSWEKLTGYVKQMGLLFQPSTGAYKGMGGFASMAKGFGETWDWHHFWSLTAFLSLALAFMNLLPIPMLDGGYVLFTLIEMITGKKVPEKVMNVLNTIGFIIVIALLVFSNGNDILRKFISK